MSIRPDLHDADGLERYKRGMDASRSDKAAILPLIHGRQILELGCGNGAVLSLIAGAYPEAKITGLDFASGLLHAAAQRDYGTADVRLIRADAHSEAYELKGGQLYDSVVLCSFLHEIFSGALQGGAAKGDFGDPFSAGNKAVKQLLGELRYVMEDSADLVIRDGIEPEPCELAVRFKSPSAEIAFHRFAEDYKGFPVSYEIRKDAGGSKALCPVRQTVYHMPSSTFYEFATKYIYADSPNWHIEMTEVFGWSRLRQLRSLLVGVGYEVDSFKTYTVPYLKTRWEEDFTVTAAANGQVYEMHSTVLIGASREPRETK